MIQGAEGDEIEEFMDGGSSREVSNVDGTAGSNICSTKSNLEGSWRILCLLLSKSDGKAMMERQ